LPRRALERDRTVNSIDLKDEREILRQISRLEKSRREADARDARDRRIKDKKVRGAFRGRRGRGGGGRCCF
jgi:hypothetical protein